VVDRTEQRRLMLVCELGQAALFAVLALTLPPFPLLLALVAGVALLTTLFQPAGRSVLPALVADQDIPAANALRGIGAHLGLIAGPALGGVLVAGVGLRAALLVDVATFLASAALLRQLPPLPSAPTAPGGRAGVLLATWEGLRAVARQPTARAVGLSLFLVVTFAGLDNVAAVFLAQNVFHQGPQGVGLLAAAYGFGMALAALGLLRWGTQIAPAGMLLLGIALLGGGELATGLAPVFALALLTQALAGAGNSLQNIANDTLLQRAVPRPERGRVFGTVYTGVAVGENIAYAAGGPLLDRTSARLLYVVAGGGTLLVLALVGALLRDAAAAAASKREIEERQRP
jgi:MFS family permease